MNGYENTLAFDCNSPRTITMNGETFYLGQGCTHCGTWIGGDHNFKHCPNCGAHLAYVESAEIVSHAQGR